MEGLFARYGGVTYSLAHRITGSDRASQDVVRGIFATLWDDASRLDASPGAVGAWLVSLARLRAIEVVRREALERPGALDVDVPIETGLDEVGQAAAINVSRERVRAVVAALPSEQREALELAFYGGLTHVELADRLRIPLGTARTRIRTALLRLRDGLGSCQRPGRSSADSATSSRRTGRNSTQIPKTVAEAPGGRGPAQDGDRAHRAPLPAKVRLAHALVLGQGER